MKNLAGRAMRVLTAFVSFVMVLSIGYAHAATTMTPPINYVYDEIGRLTGTYDVVGNSAQYSYDQVGNLLSITRKNAGAVTILDFTPDSAPVGENVTITGTGFSSTISQNNVSFNGVVATITSATENTLITTVPTAAISGPIAITTPNGTAKSSSNFIVSLPGTGIAAPIIISFTPTMAAANATAVIAGSGFQTNLNNNKVTVNGITLKISAATATSISAVIPSNVGSGKIKVSTPYGEAISAGYLTIVPSTINVADIVSSAQIAVDGIAQPVTVPTVNKIGMVLFDANKNDYLTIDASNFVVVPTGSAVTYEVYRPDNSLLKSGTIASSATSIHLPQLPSTGTYAIYFKPGTATASFSVSASRNKQIVVDDVSIASTISYTGGSTRFTFSGTAGQNLGLGITGLALAPTGSTYAAVTIYSQSSTVAWKSTYCYTSKTVNGGCSLNLISLPETGIYSIEVTPYAGGTGSFIATLTTEVTGSLIVGTASSVSIPRAGQVARYSFSGTIGDQLGLSLSSVAITGSTDGITATVYTTDGVTVLTSVSFVNASTGTIDVPALPNALPASGVYTVLLDPPYAATASMQVLLTQDVLVPLAIDGNASNVNLTQTGQKARLTFSGTAGQNLGLGITGLALSPTTSTYASVTVYKPNGAILTSMSCNTSYTPKGGCDLDLTNLPETGTYTVSVKPYQGGTGSFSATLSTEVTGSLAVGTTYNLNLSRAGQDGRLSFIGAAATNLSIAFSSLTTIPTGQLVSFKIYQPSGSVLISSSSKSDFIWNLTNLPATGTYTLVVDPTYAAKADMNITLMP